MTSLLVTMIALGLMALVSVASSSPFEIDVAAELQSSGAELQSTGLSQVPQSIPATGPTNLHPTDEAEPTPTGDPSDDSPGYAALRRAWSRYPWPPDYEGKACSAPRLGRVGPDGQIVVVLGDSLIRNDAPTIKRDLRARGFTPVLVCWGGKTLAWGIEQLQIMRRRDLLPSCLVVNLGTNDVMSYAVTGPELRYRLTPLLARTTAIPHVLVVDIWANTAIAPSTMVNIGQTPKAYRRAVAKAHHGTVIPWSRHARRDPGLVGWDGAHDSASGVQARGELIADAVARTC